jgi:glycosyltransferase involved in cell wall biosynthesis
VRTVRVIGNLEPGGGQLSALRLGIALERREWEVRFLAGSASPGGVELARSHGVEVEVYGAPRSLQYQCDEGFSDWLSPRLAGADLIHAHQFGAWWAAARAAPPAAPVVGSEHNAYQWPGLPPVRRLRSALDRIDLLFVHGPAARDELLALGAVPSLLREGRSAIDPAQVARPAGLPRRRLVYVGRLHREKGPDLLLEALALLSDRPPLYLVGSGPLEPELRTQARRLGIEDDVVFAGWQQRPTDWLAGSAACVVPSRCDAWSQTAVLAMALGVPVVGTAVEGLEHVLSGGRGIAVAPEDPRQLATALVSLLQGRTRTDLEAARRYAATFTAERVADLYEQSYIELLSQAGRAGPRRRPAPRRRSPSRPWASRRSGSRPDRAASCRRRQAGP